MSDNLVPFWEKSYREYDAITFSNKPNSTITEFEHLIGNPSKVYQFEQRYDMITCFGTLHFVTKNYWKRFINNAKKYTNIGGIHIIQIFTDTVPASEDIAPFAIGLAKDEELKELYADWEILQFKSYVFEDEHPNVPKHLHASNKIVARKVR